MTDTDKLADLKDRWYRWSDDQIGIVDDIKWLIGHCERMGEMIATSTRNDPLTAEVDRLKGQLHTLYECRFEPDKMLILVEHYHGRTK